VLGDKKKYMLDITRIGKVHPECVDIWRKHESTCKWVLHQLEAHTCPLLVCNTEFEWIGAHRQEAVSPCGECMCLFLLGGKYKLEFECLGLQLSKYGPVHSN